MKLLKMTAQEIESLIAVIIFWGVTALAIFLAVIAIIISKDKTK